MQDICCKLSRIAAVVVILVAACVGSAWGQFYGGIPWQVGDIVVCFGNGTCNVLRNTSNGLKLLDQINDGLTGDTFGTGMNNTLHLVTTDNGGGTQSKVVVYTIASLDANGVATAHTPLHTLDASLPFGTFANGTTDIRAVAQDANGNFFVGNANPSTIVELDQNGNGVNLFAIPSSALAAWQFTHTYSVTQTILDPNERVQKVTTPGTSGPSRPTFNDALGTTTDGLVWTNQGTWTSGATYTQNVSTVGDTGQHLWLATIGGISGSTSPAFASNDSTAFIYDNAVTWTDRGTWQANTVYPTVPPNVLSPRLSYVGDTNLNLWHVTPLPVGNATGTSGPTRPPFEGSDGSNAMLVDGLQWTNTTNSCSPGSGPNPDWIAGTQYYTVGTLICESTTSMIWSVATPGTSGANRPGFAADATQPVPDNALTWTDQGAYAWASTQYAAGAMVVDPAGHVQQVTTQGRSGATAPSAATNNAWNDSAPPYFGGKTQDGLQWTNKGSYAWKNSTLYSVFLPANPTDANTVVVDPAGNVQHVKLAGTSTASPATAPVEQGISSGWSPNPGQDTFDNAVIWTDNNFVTFGSNCITTQMNSLDLDATGNVIYFSSGPGVVQEVTGMSSCTVVADFGPNVVLHAIRAVPPQSMPASCNGSPCPNTNGGILVVANGTIDIDSNDTTDPDETSGESPINICTNTTAASPSTCALLLDAGTGQIVTRYPVSAATSTLQALTLDPLVTDCSGNACASTYTAQPKVNNFWVGESGNSNFYRVDFVTGIPSLAFDANASPVPCPQNETCTPLVNANKIQGMAIYAGEGANQPNLAKLITTTTPTSTAGLPVTTNVQFLQNKLGVSLYPSSSTATVPPTAIALYASLINEATCLNDQGTESCTPTTYFPSTTNINPNAAIVWKIDVPNGSTTPPSGPISSKLSGPGIGTDTDFFRDASIDDTIQVGNIDPMKCCTSSTAGPYLIRKSGQPEADFGCTIISPIAKCFQSPSNISIKMQCTSYPGGTGQFGVSSQTPWGPRLQIMKQPHLPGGGTGGASGTCFGVAPNNANATALHGNPAAFVNPSECSQNQLVSNSDSYVTARFDTNKQNWVFNWQVPSGANNTYTATFYDDTNGTATGTNHASSKPVVSGAFVIAPKCP